MGAGKNAGKEGSEGKRGECGLEEKCGERRVVKK